MPARRTTHDMFKLTVKTLACAAMTLALGACASINASSYTPSVENIETLKSAGPLQTRVRTFSADTTTDNPYPVQVRAARMVSPVGGSFGAYVSNALATELAMSDAVSPDARVEISGALLKNDVDAAVGQGTGTVSVRFVVRRGTQVVYDSVKTATDHWDSSFMGNIAIPAATAAYPHIIQKLLASLYADPLFLASVH
jgi:hypothetical protein